MTINFCMVFQVSTRIFLVHGAVYTLYWWVMRVCFIVSL